MRPAVLIPRPETEELVEAALDLLAEAAGLEETASSVPPSLSPLIADVGTGSGAIALSLAQEGGYAVLATDLQCRGLGRRGAKCRPRWAWKHWWS